jgi:hypothetical protein
MVNFNTKQSETSFHVPKRSIFWDIQSLCRDPVGKPDVGVPLMIFTLKMLMVH